MPEKIKDIGKNIAFAGIDDQTGDIYVIEINPVVKNKFNQIRSVFKTNARQYEKYKLAESPVLQPSPTKDKQLAGRTLTSFLRNNNANSEISKSESEIFRFLFSEYSEEEHDLIVAVLKPFVGFNIKCDIEKQPLYFSIQYLRMRKRWMFSPVTTGMKISGWA